MTRQPIFDTFRKILGRGFTQHEVKLIDAALDEAEGVIVVTAPDPEWMDLAAPLVEKWEGLHRLIPGDKVVAYPDPGTGGEPWTIGIGSTTDEDGNPVPRDAVWTVERARRRFRSHLAEFGEHVDRALAGKPATAAQKAALTSLAYNIGPSAFARSTVLKRHRAGDYAGAADAFSMWVKAGGRVMKGLQRRRADEAKLYRGQA